MSTDTECYVCEGTDPQWFSIRCEKHDICLKCGINRKDLKEPPWGAIGGFICRECEEKRQKKAIADYDSSGKSYEYGDTPICPYCGEKYNIDEHYSLYDDDNNEDIECPNCGSMFNCNTYVSYSFTCRKIGKEK